MSSEQFEHYEYEFENITKSINKKINSQLPNFTGEQRKQCQRQAQKEIERAEDLLQDMEMEARSAPPSYRTKMNARVRGYNADIEKFRRDLSNVSSGGGSYQNDRDALFAGGDSFEGQNYNQRSRLLDNEQTLGRTSDRIANAQRIGEESEAIGAGVLTELDSQRQTIIRTGQKVSSTDANLGKSRRILNAMARRIMTNHLIMVLIIIVLMGILGMLVSLFYVRYLYRAATLGV
eukprot:m.1580983 g.1580983  ORF g.1580983 m.1580983 type:complete len:234 (-) comp25315_c0_seq44:1262-1963(-)